MAKKKNKKKKTQVQQQSLSSTIINMAAYDNKALGKEFNKVLKDVEAAQISMMEADKYYKRAKRKPTNKKQGEFYTNMEGLRARQKLANDWEKTGFLDRLINLLQTSAPIIKTIGKIIASMIIMFISLDSIARKINPDTLQKLSSIFNFVISL